MLIWKPSLPKYNYEYPLVSGSNEMLSTAKSKQDIKADTVELQDNPAYVATNEFS